MKMSRKDPLIKKILSKGPHVPELTAGELVKFFPALKEHFMLQEVCNMNQFGRFWCTFRKRELAKLKRLEINTTVPASATILPTLEAEGKPQAVAASTNMMHPDDAFIKFLCEDRHFLKYYQIP